MIITGLVEKTKDRTPVNGNNCNHSPCNPKLKLSKDVSSSLPKILLTLLDRVEQYYRKPSLIPSLNAANESDRQQRTERREACIQTLKAIIKFTDLTTLMVCIPNSKGRQALEHRVMLKQTELNPSRYKRAIHDLKKAGIITVTQVNEEISEGIYEGRAAIKCLSKQLFGVFGLGMWLKYEREKASKRASHKAHAEAVKSPKKRTRNDIARAKLAMNAADAKREKAARVRNNLIIKLKGKNPDMSWGELNALASLTLT